MHVETFTISYRCNSSCETRRVVTHPHIEPCTNRLMHESPEYSIHTMLSILFRNVYSLFLVPQAQDLKLYKEKNEEGGFWARAVNEIIHFQKYKAKMHYSISVYLVVSCWKSAKHPVCK